MYNPVQLQIAARIHIAFKQALGEGFDVMAMLKEPDEAREVLFVCQAFGNAELMSLARKFVAAGKPGEKSVDKATQPLRVPKALEATQLDSPQDAAWSHSHSGFGMQATTSGDPHTADRSWRLATQWLRRPKR